MDALKWILKASLMVAIMFLGLKAETDKDGDEKQNTVASLIRIL